jgi:hypothetical protein
MSRTVQRLKNVSLKVSKELITKSRHPIRKCLPNQHSPFYMQDALYATLPKIVSEFFFNTYVSA